LHRCRFRAADCARFFSIVSRKPLPLISLLCVVEALLQLIHPDAACLPLPVAIAILLRKEPLKRPNFPLILPALPVEARQFAVEGRGSADLGLLGFLDSAL
jgi:hypothetical protein